MTDTSRPRALSIAFAVGAVLALGAAVGGVPGAILAALAQPAFAPYRGEEIFPGAAVQAEADLVAFIRRKAESIYHPVGTCRMGDAADATTVVDPQLRVKGVDGLRVVDASVMPRLIGGNTNAPTMMIAERAADLIRHRAA